MLASKREQCLPQRCAVSSAVSMAQWYDCIARCARVLWLPFRLSLQVVAFLLIVCVSLSLYVSCCVLCKQTGWWEHLYSFLQCSSLCSFLRVVSDCLLLHTCALYEYHMYKHHNQFTHTSAQPNLRPPRVAVVVSGNLECAGDVVYRQKWTLTEHAKRHSMDVARI